MLFQNKIKNYSSTISRYMFDILFNNKHNKEIIYKIEHYNFSTCEKKTIYKRSVLFFLPDIFAIAIKPINTFVLDSFLDELECILYDKYTCVYIHLFNGKKIIMHLKNNTRARKCVYAAISSDSPFHKEITPFINDHSFCYDNLTISAFVKMMHITSFINKKTFSKIKDEDFKLSVLNNNFKERILSKDSLLNFD